MVLIAHQQYFSAVGSDTPIGLATGSPALALLRMSPVLYTSTVSLWLPSSEIPAPGSVVADGGRRDCMPRPETFLAQSRNSPAFKPVSSRLSNAKL